MARRSAALDLALDAVDDLRNDLRRYWNTAEAASALLPPVGSIPASAILAVLIEIGDSRRSVADLVVGLRRDPSMARTPIVVWGTADACRKFDPGNAAHVNSYVLTGSDPSATASLLASTIHYWTVVNRPSLPVPGAAEGAHE